MKSVDHLLRKALQYGTVAILVFVASATRTNALNRFSVISESRYFLIQEKAISGDSSLAQEMEGYQQKQRELAKRLNSLKEIENVVRNDVVGYAQYKSKDTLGIIKLWLNEFRAVTRFSGSRLQPVEQAILNRVANGNAGGKSVLNSLNMYCLDILLLNMTAPEYGQYTKDRQFLHRWLAARASDKLYIYYKTELKLSNEQIQDSYERLLTNRQGRTAEQNKPSLGC